MNVVTFETAKRLKEAGFPQPEPQEGQRFYQDDGDKFIYAERLCSQECVDGWQTISCDSVEDYDIFAPSATDILEYLYDGPMKGVEWSLTKRGKNWTCTKRFWTDESYCVDAWHDHENPAEACSSAWLSLYEKTTNQ